MQIKATPYTYTDISGLNELKKTARTDQKSALHDVARQFESLFLKMMLKSMRDASFGDPIFDNNQSKFYRDMFDNQLALSLSKGKGIGLAETLARQLGKQLPVQEKAQDTLTSAKQTRPVQIAYSQPITTAPVRAEKIRQFISTMAKAEPKPAVEVPNKAAPPTPQQLGSVEKFVRTLWPMAERAAEELNTQPEILLAQAALETGWGKYISKDENGRSSYNLFNIKAGRNWDGNHIEKKTVEFKDSKAVTENARFRAYDSFEESFQDYVDFLKSSKRYESALQVSEMPSAYITRLQKAGYATDPEYANKVLKIMEREWDVFEKYSSVAEGVPHDV